MDWWKNLEDICWLHHDEDMWTRLTWVTWWRCCVGKQRHLVDKRVYVFADQWTIINNGIRNPKGLNLWSKTLVDMDQWGPQRFQGNFPAASSVPDGDVPVSPRRCRWWEGIDPTSRGSLQTLLVNRNIIFNQLISRPITALGRGLRVRVGVSVGYRITTTSFIYFIYCSRSFQWDTVWSIIQHSELSSFLKNHILHL